MTAKTDSAYETAKLIRYKSTFTITGHNQRAGNGHSRTYHFPDGSRLTIGKGWQKSYDASGFCILHGTIAANAFGSRHS